MPVYKFGGYPEIEEEETDILERVDEQYVRLNGDNTFTGHLDMGGNKIVRVSEPVHDGDATTKKYVDDVKAYSEALTESMHSAVDTKIREQVVHKIQSPRQKLTVSTEDGNVIDSSLAVADVALKSDITSKLPSAIGNRVLVSDSDGNIVESDPMLYTSVKASSRVISAYIRNLSNKSFETLPLKAGTYRITVDCNFTGLLPSTKEMYLGIREKDNVDGRGIRWRVAVSQVNGGGYIGQPSIVKIARDITNAIFVPIIDTAWTTPNTPWVCEFFIERLT